MEHKIKKVQNMSLNVLRSCQIDTPILAFEETSRVQKSQKNDKSEVTFLIHNIRKCRTKKAICAAILHFVYIPHPSQNKSK